MSSSFSFLTPYIHTIHNFLQDEHGEVCPANWTEGSATMKPDPKGSLEYFASANHPNKRKRVDWTSLLDSNLFEHCSLIDDVYIFFFIPFFDVLGVMFSFPPRCDTRFAPALSTLLCVVWHPHYPLWLVFWLWLRLWSWVTPWLWFTNTLGSLSTLRYSIFYRSTLFLSGTLYPRPLLKMQHGMAWYITRLSIRRTSRSRLFTRLILIYRLCGFRLDFSCPMYQLLNLKTGHSSLYTLIICWSSTPNTWNPHGPVLSFTPSLSVLGYSTTWIQSEIIFTYLTYHHLLPLHPPLPIPKTVQAYGCRFRSAVV